MIFSADQIMTNLVSALVNTLCRRYALDFEDRLAITDYKGQEEGYIYVNVTPCTQAGKALDEDYFVDNSTDLLGKPYYFKVTKSLKW